MTIRFYEFIDMTIRFSYYEWRYFSGSIKGKLDFVCAGHTSEFGAFDRFKM